MPHSAKILLDSISTQGHRLTTFELVFPRIILAEWNTHRVFSRNSASSRAIPVKKMIERVMEDPYIPTTWGKNQKGMQAAEEILGDSALSCERAWLIARDQAVAAAENLVEIGVHKQTTNRLLEPFMWHTIVNSATEYSNFYGLRDDKMAHPDIQIAAGLMRDLHKLNEPVLRKAGTSREWHTPYATDQEVLGSWATEVKITAGRCARVSYLTHDGLRDPVRDMELHDTLLASGHMSPLEHAARPMDIREYNYFFKQPKAVWDSFGQKFIHAEDDGGDPLFTHFCGNMQGWVQYRKQIPHEEDYGTYLKAQMGQTT